MRVRVPHGAPCKDLLVRILAVASSLVCTSWGMAVLTDREGGAIAAAVLIARWMPVATLAATAFLVLASARQWALLLSASLVAIAYSFYHSIVDDGTWQWFSDAQPGLLVAVGVILAGASLVPRSARTVRRGDVRITAVLSRRLIRIASIDLEAVKVWCLLGSVELDLAWAAPTANGARVDVRLLGARLEIVQPPPYATDSFDPEMVVIPKTGDERQKALENEFLTVYGVQLFSAVRFRSVA